jgi:hypothetical protein
MQTKKCTKCGEVRKFSEFYGDKRSSDLLVSSCKECEIIRKRQYRRTKTGLITQIYASQKITSKKRKHSPPSYSKKELRQWMFGQDVFHTLFDQWVLSGFSKPTVPSCDRLDDYLPYTLNNIAITMWAENELRGHQDRRNGVNNKCSKEVIGIHKISGVKVEFCSTRQAERKTGIQHTNISACCTGKIKSRYAGGFLWKYVDKY